MQANGAAATQEAVQPLEELGMAQGHPYGMRRADVDDSIERSQVEPGALSHLHPPRIAPRPKVDS